MHSPAGSGGEPAPSRCGRRYDRSVRSSRGSSRSRFTEYKRELDERRAKGDMTTPTKAAARAASLGHPGIGSTAGVGHKRQRGFGVLLREFFKMLRGHRLMLAALLGTLTFSTLLGLIPPYGTKLVFDCVLGSRPIQNDLPSWLHVSLNPRELLAWVALGMVALSVVSVLVNIWGRWHATRITKRLQISVRRQVFSHAVRLPLHRVYDLKSGGAASLLREDAGGVGELLFAVIYNPWRAIIQLVGSVTILAFTDWRLLLGSLVLLPVVYFSHKTWIARIRPVFGDVRASRTHTDSHATETFGGMRVVRSFSRQRSEASQFTRNNALMARQEILAWWWSRGVDVAWALFIPTASAALLWYGGNRILDDAARVAAGTLSANDAFTIGDLAMFLAYLAWLLGPIEALAASATAFQNNLAGLDRVLNVLAEPTEMPSKPGARVLGRHTPAGRISVNHVSYTYPNTKTEVLHDITFDAEPGEMIAFVGPSGAGKTTVCNLVARFYDPTSGSISFDGTDLRDITVDSYRSLLGIVEQDTFLFDGSIADNIAYGRRDATMEQIADAARKANADGFISALPKGYASRIGERGVKLSGGQRQRLTIARAILADPRILILDEATSNLDTESERLIQTSLHTLMAGRTSLVIAHRLSTIAHAHKIIVIENGRVVEMGPHTQLMERSGRYRQMVELQTAPPQPPASPVASPPPPAHP
ncbi:MAG: ABC transporter ATP-binding protein/permease [Planctomycetes bacterium]|nr:ABC transporter ATP-binding protein/permease [Planctomycetota bacterium]